MEISATLLPVANHLPIDMAVAPEELVYHLREENQFKLDPAFVAEYVDKQPPWGFGALSYITFKRTYARPVTKAQLYKEARLYLGMDDKEARQRVDASTQTTEEFWQALVRITEGQSSVYKQHVKDTGQPWSDEEEQEHAQEFFRRKWDFRLSVPGRGMWGMGTRALQVKGSAMLNNCFSGTEKFITREYGPVTFHQLSGTSVTVLTPDGWAPATIAEFGEQKVQRVTFAPANFSTRNGTPRAARSNLRHVVEVTPDHRWLTLNRGEVTDLAEGDLVAALVNKDETVSESYRSGRVHGLIFGDGTAGYQRLTTNLRSYHVRLCGKKADENLQYFSNVTYPDSYNGDPYCHVQSSADLKELPVGASVDYLRGFLDGWLAADGSVRNTEHESYRLSSEHQDTEAWLREHAATAGWLLSGVSQDRTVQTNFGERKSPLMVFSLTRAPGAWVVRQIEPLDAPETVYCAQVPGVRSFALASGIHTGNCGFLSTEHIDLNPVQPFEMFMDYLMLGVGMGFDVRGAGKATLVEPTYVHEAHVVPDTREGWIEALGRVLGAYRGRNSLPTSWDFSKIRPEGAPLETFGGTASGPGPLIRLLNEAQRICRGFVGKKITSTWITDIMNLIGVCVVAGNVRRSSEIALGSMDDHDFMALKDNTDTIALYGEIERLRQSLPLAHQYARLRETLYKMQSLHSVLDPEYAKAQDELDALSLREKADLEALPAYREAKNALDNHPLFTHRWASNNTVLAKVGETDYDKIAELIAKNGEPGVGWMDVIRAHGRLADPADHKDAKAMGFNPCVPGDTRILTRDGYAPIVDLVGKPVEVWNGEAWAPVTPRVTGHNEPLVRVTLSDGTSLVCTEYHKWHLAPKRRGDDVEVVPAIALEPGDALAKFDMPVVEGGADWPQAYTHGFYCGDGQTSESGSKSALLYGEKQQLVDKLHTTSVSPKDKYDRVYVGLPKTLPEKFTVRFDVDVQSRLEWLAGLLDSDGCIIRNSNSLGLQICSINHAFLMDVRLMLTTLGVQAKVSTAREEGTRSMPDGKGGTADYHCATSYRLLVNASDTYKLVEMGLRTHRLDLPGRKPQRDARRFVTVESVEKVGVADTVYCFEEPISHRGTFEGIVTGQCAEQPLHDGELCCLVETYPSRHDSLEDFLVTLKYAYRYAKIVTIIPTHNKKTNAVMVRNRRIGTSMAGIMDLYAKLGLTECKRWWDAGYAEICRWDREYSSWLGVNESIKKTSIKPGGSVPLLAGVEGGMKSPTSRYYMRTIRIDHISPLIPALKEAGYRMEPDRTTPRTTVVYFPCEAKGPARLAKDVSLWEQAAVYTALQRHWADNMVSATLMFQPHEVPDIARVLKVYEGQWKAISFLPLSDHGYLQAPYTPCTEAEYLYAVSQLKPIAFDGLQIGHDTDDKYCAGGVCELPVSAS